MRMLIYVILRGLCFINEWNAIINLQNNMVKNIQNLTNYIYIYIYILSDSTVDPLVRVHVGVLERVVIGHACLMDVNGYVICCAGA